MAEKTNAQRFISAYNTIDHALRNQYNFKRSMSFSDMIRRAVSVNYIARRYEDKLIDYGRLRNAIIHKSSDEYIIAEPHGDVVLEFEKIATLLSTPPNVLQVIKQQQVVVANHSDSLKSVICLMNKSTFSNIPIYKDTNLVGVANGQRLCDYLGAKLNQNISLDKLISATSIGEALAELPVLPYYEIAKANLTLEEALDHFYKNRKLFIIIITKNGLSSEMPIGIVTAGDVIELNKILEDY